MKRVLLLMIFQLYILGAFAQDPQFSQFYAAPLYLGPSMAGVGEAPRISANYRDQWPKLSGRFITYAFSVDNFFERYRSGLGLMLLYDKAGGNKINTFQAGLNYSYRIEVTRNFYVQPGLAFQYFDRSINYNSLQFADQFFGSTVMPTSIETLPGNAKGHTDFSSSVLAFGKNFWVGITLDHMMKLNKSLEDNDMYMPLKTSFYGGYKFLIKEALLNSLEQSISVAYQYRMQAGLEQLDMGVYYKQHPFMVGVWYRGVPLLKSTQSRDAITLLGGLEFDKFAISYSYDFTVSNLITSTGGANEIALTYRFEQLKHYKRRHLGSVPCPKF